MAITSGIVHCKYGSTFAQIDEFWEKHKISPQQVKYDLEYLYGLLQSATKDRKNAIVMEYQSRGDGLGAWLKLQEDFDFGGSRKEWSDTLEDKLRTSYYIILHE